MSREALKPLAWRDQTLLSAVVAKRRPQLLSVVETIGSVPLTDEGRESLRIVLAEELSASGLDPDGEPNTRGKEIDELIGKLRRV